MKLTPLYDRVVIKPAPPEEVTKGGIIIPDTAKEKPQQGEVVAVGKGKLTEDGKLIPLQVKVGDQVLFGKYAGTEVKIDGEEYLIMRERRHLAIIDTNGQS
jgi:chaperonin GroES